MKRILDKRNMTEADWQAYRMKQSGIGGSEVSSILGVNPYQAKFTLWLEKTGQKEREKVDNEFVEWGNALEPLIRKKFAEKTGFKVFQNNFVLQHDEHEFMIANIDGEVKDPDRKGRGVLEIKTTSEWNKGSYEGEQVPVQYMAQMQHYLAVTGYEYGYLAVLIGGNKYKHFLVERNENIISMMIEKEREFIEAVEKVEYPWEIGGSKAESDWLAQEYPEALDEVMSIPEAIEKLALEYNELQGDIKELTKRSEEIKNQIKLEAKDIKTLKGNNVKIVMPTITRTTFDSKAFQKDHEDLYTTYKTKTSSYRGFKINLLDKMEA